MEAVHDIQAVALRIVDFVSPASQVASLDPTRVPTGVPHDTILQILGVDFFPGIQAPSVVWDSAQDSTGDNYAWMGCESDPHSVSDSAKILSDLGASDPGMTPLSSGSLSAILVGMMSAALDSREIRYRKISSFAHLHPGDRTTHDLASACSRRIQECGN